MNRAARLLGLALSSAILVPIGQTPAFSRENKSSEQGEILDLSNLSDREVEALAREEFSTFNFCDNLQPLHTLQAHSSTVTSMAIDAAGKTLVSGGEDGTVKVWDLESGQLIRDFRNPWVRVGHVEISEDGRTVAAAPIHRGSRSLAANHEIKVWDVATGEVKRSFEPIEFNEFRISQNGDHLIVGDEIYLNIETGQRISRLPQSQLQNQSRYTNQAGDKFSVEDGHLIYSNFDGMGSDCHLTLPDHNNWRQPAIVVDTEKRILSIAVNDDIFIVSINIACKTPEENSQVVLADELYNSGIEKLELKFTYPAYKDLNNALEIYRSSCDSQGVAKALYQIHKIHTQNPFSIIDTTLKIAISELYKSESSNPNHEEILTLRGNALYDLGVLFLNRSKNGRGHDDHSENLALLSLRDSLRICIVQDSENCKLERLIALSNYWNQLNQPHLAKTYLDRALRIAQDNGLLEVVRDVLLKTGNYEAALEIYRENQDIAGEAKVLQIIASEYLEETQEKLSYYERSLQKSRDIGDKLGEADTLLLLSIFRWNSSRSTESEISLVSSDLLTALEIYAGLGEREKEANTLQLLGRYYQMLAFPSAEIPATGKFSSDEFFQNKRQSINYYESAFRIYSELDHILGQGETLIELGKMYRSLHEYEKALNLYANAKTKLKGVIDGMTEADLLSNIAMLHRLMENDEQALEHYNQALYLCSDLASDCDAPRSEYFRNSGMLSYYTRIGEIEPFNARDIYNNIGEIHFKRRDYTQALDSFEMAVRVDNAYYFNVIALMNLGLTYSRLNKPNLALRFLNHALDAECSAGSQQIAGNIRGEFSALMELPDENERFTQCIAAHGIALAEQGSIYGKQGELNQSINSYRQALNIFEGIDAAELTAKTLINIGLTYSSFGRTEQAQSAYNQALLISQRTNNDLIEAQVFNNLGGLYRVQGLYSQALSAHRESRSIFEALNDVEGLSASLHNLAGVYASLGQLAEALDFYDEALLIRQGINDWSGIGQTLNNIAIVYLAQGDVIRAEEFYRDSIATYDQTDDQSSEATVLNNLAFLYIQQGRFKEAKALLIQAITIAENLGDKAREGDFLDSLGTLYAQLGRYEDAMATYHKALGLLRNTNSRAAERNTLSNVGALLYQQNQIDEAILMYKASVNIAEEMRQNIRVLSLEQQKSFTETVADDYRLLADLLLQQGRIPEAQQVLDLLKLEELREFTDTRAVWTSDGLQLTAAEQTVADAHGSLIVLGADVVECERTNCPDIETLYDRQQTLLAQYDREVARFTATIRDNRGDDGIFQDPERISGDAQDLLEAYAAEGETALLIYPFVLEDKLWLVWATVGNVIGSIEVPVARGDLSATVQRLGELLQTGDTRNIADLQATSQQLYDWLIAPLEGELAANDIDHLVFVNDRVTRYIPMAVLHDGDQYLLERYTLSTVLAPGATEMGDRLGPVPETPVLGLGVTRPIGDFNALPAVGPELAAIVQGPEGDGVYPGQVFLDEAFTLDALERNVAAHRVLHIATHAEFVPGRKEESYILLGDGSPLRIPDIERIERRLNNLHLVVLSACQTALGGPDQDGAEIAGLSSYFLEARRAEAVIASLWSVNDTSTSVLMQRFYALLATGEFTKSEALRQAQLSLLNGEDLAALADRLATARAGARPVLEAGTELPPDLGHRHPYHWAPFILIGNGL